MPSQKYLFLHRSAPVRTKPSQQPPSPAQMQEMFAAFNAWKEKFKDNIVDMGGKLKPGGKVVTASGVTDGPFVEAKEIVGGLHDRHRRELRAARSRSRGRCRDDDARREHRDPGDGGRLSDDSEQEVGRDRAQRRAWSSTSSGTSTAGWSPCSRAWSGSGTSSSSRMRSRPRS